MIALLIVLRILHILGGVFWAGGVFTFARFVEPTATAAGDDGRRFLQRFAATSGYPVSMMVGATVTILAGFSLLWIDSGGFSPEWMRSGTGIVISTGMLFALAAAVVGIGIGARNAGRLGRIARAVHAQGGPPSAEQAAAMESLIVKLRTGARWTAVLLVVTVCCMAVARYAPF